ncbi:hypothetical protein AMQ83_26045, partial [Paenibacillus riograndensis]
GGLQEGVCQLWAFARLKVYGKRSGMEAMVRGGYEVSINFHEGSTGAFDRAKLAKGGNSFERRVQFDMDAKATIRVKSKNLEDKELLDLLEQFLAAAKQSLKSKGELHNVIK